MNACLRILSPALCASLVGLNAVATPFAYDNDVERFGAAIAAQQGRREMVKKAMEYCADTFPALQWDANAAFARWVRRQAGFLHLVTSMEQELDQAATKDPDDGDRWKRILEDMPGRVRSAGAVLAKAIADASSEEARRKMCSGNIAEVNSRKLDIENAEPETAKYLRGMAGKLRIRLPDPEAALATASPDARRDAAALAGEWRTEKITYYLADGRFGEDDAQCTLEFSEKTLLSRCRAGGQQFRVVYSYRVSEPGRYDAEVVENNAYPELVGGREVTAFRVENGKLTLSSFLPAADAAPMRPIEIEAVLVPGILSGRRR
jgi:hypothetical protein